MAKPGRTCFGRGVCLHIGPCCDFWADDGMCVCNPVDAAEYPNGQRLYIAGNISGFSSPNIRTIFPDGRDHVRTFDRGDYCWAWWDWGSGTIGTVKFELRDGSNVRASRSTTIIGPTADLHLTDISIPESIVDGDPLPISFTIVNVGTIDAAIQYGAAINNTTVWGNYGGREWFSIHAGEDLDFYKTYYTQVFDIGGSIPGPGKHTVSLILAQRDRTDIRHDAIVTVTPSPMDPCEGVTCDPECVGTDLYDSTCVDGVCVRGALIEADSVQCGFVCAEGEKRNPRTCWDGSKIYQEVCKNNKWVPSGEVCPEKPECTEGDKKAGYVCVAGKWKEVTVIEPVVEPEVEEAAATIAELEAAVVAARTAEERLTALAALASAIAAAKAEEKKCYIKFDIPLLDRIPGIPCQPWIPILPGFKRSDKP